VENGVVQSPVPEAAEAGAAQSRVGASVVVVEVEVVEVVPVDPPLPPVEVLPEVVPVDPPLPPVEVLSEVVADVETLLDAAVPPVPAGGLSPVQAADTASARRAAECVWRRMRGLGCSPEPGVQRGDSPSRGGARSSRHGLRRRAEDLPAPPRRCTVRR
jgi:hypothetical protein